MPTYNIEVLNKCVFAYVIFIEIILYDAKDASKYSLFFKKKLLTTILYNDVVLIMAYVVDRAFGLGTYIMDKVLGHA